MTNDELDRLEQIAKAATPGRWAIQGAQSDYEIIGDIQRSEHGWAIGTTVLTLDTWKPMPTVANAAHIAAFNPQTALRLLAEVTRLTSERDALAQSVEALRQELATAIGQNEELRKRDS